MQPDLRSTLSTMLENYRQNIAMNVLLSLSFCGIKISIAGSKNFQKKHSSCRTSVFRNVLVLVWFLLVSKGKSRNRNFFTPVSDKSHSHTRTPFDAPWKQAFWKHWENEKLLIIEQFLLFPKVFSIRLNNFLPLSSNLKLSSANSFNLEESQICHLVMG